MFNSNVFDATKRVFHKHNLSSSEQEKTNITSHPPHILNKTFTKGRFQKKEKLMEFSLKGPDPGSQPLNGKKNKTWSKNALNHLK